MGYYKCFRIDHGKNEFAKWHNHINGIEGFWGIAKTSLGKFRGMSKNTFYLNCSPISLSGNWIICLQAGEAVSGYLQLQRVCDSYWGYTPMQ